MTAPNLTATSTADREIAQTRIFRAPRELVFEMWTNPEHIVNWYGPKGFTDTVIEMDVRPGGMWRHVMHGPDGVDHHNDCRYLEIVRPERLVYEHLSPPEFVATVTFEDLGDETKMTMQMVFESPELRNDTVEKYGAIEGLTQTLGRLEQLLAKHHPSAS
jgi:uncharacterized protein YndB with AHSA1/START domain